MNLLFLAFSQFILWTYAPEDATLYGVTHFEFYMGVQSVVAGNPPVRTWTVNYPEMQQLVDGLEYGTTYYFCTKTFGAGGASNYSGELVWTPMPDPTPSPTPLPTPEPSPSPTPGPPPPTPTPPPSPEPSPSPMPSPTPDLPGQRKGWWKNQ